MSTSLERERVEPRVSVTKMGEYMIAQAARRQRIVHDQKWPSDFIVTRYKDVYSTVTSYLLSDPRDPFIIAQAIERLYNTIPETVWQVQNTQCSAEALEAFGGYANQLDFLGLHISAADPTPPYLVIEGVGISVRPEMLLTGQRRRGKPITGALKLHVSKKTPLDSEAGEYVASLVHMFLTDVLCPADSPDPAACLVLDVFTGQAFAAPRAFKRRRENIAAACREIAVRWPVA